MTQDAAPAVARPVRFNIPALPDVDGFLDDAREIIESGWLAGGPFVSRLEEELGHWTASQRVVAVTNATNGLIAALTTLGETGAEAIVPAYTFLATWQSVLWAKMTPVVADVDERGLLDPAAAGSTKGDAHRSVWSSAAAENRAIDRDGLLGREVPCETCQVRRRAAAKVGA